MAGCRHKEGFVLAEVVVVLIISSVVVAALLAALVALIRGMQPQSVSLGGEPLPVAPTFGAFPSAVRLHQVFTERVTAGRAVYVFGGRHLSLPANAPESEILPLKVQSLPAIADFSAGLPMSARSFFDGYSSTLGEQETNASTEDFSVIVIGEAAGRLDISCLAQVRRTSRSINDGATPANYVVHEVKLWDRPTKQLYRYAYAEHPSRVTRAFFGAVHTWIRYSSTAAANEEGPSCLAFPDPWLHAGEQGAAADLAPFSRFSYFVAGAL